MLHEINSVTFISYSRQDTLPERLRSRHRVIRPSGSASIMACTYKFSLLDIKPGIVELSAIRRSVGSLCGLRSVHMGGNELHDKDTEGKLVESLI